jgi:hypothetical protein
MRGYVTLMTATVLLAGCEHLAEIGNQYAGMPGVSLPLKLHPSEVPGLYCRHLEDCRFVTLALEDDGTYTCSLRGRAGTEAQVTGSWYLKNRSVSLEPSMLFGSPELVDVEGLDILTHSKGILLVDGRDNGDFLANGPTSGNCLARW